MVQVGAMGQYIVARKHEDGKTETWKKLHVSGMFSNIYVVLMCRIFLLLPLLDEH